MMSSERVAHGAPWSAVKDDENASAEFKASGHVWKVVDRFGDLSPYHHNERYYSRMTEMAALRIVEELNMRAAKIIITEGTKAANLKE